MRKNEEATIAMLANSYDDQLSSQSSVPDDAVMFSAVPEDADDCDEKAFCFWFGRILPFSNECC